MIWIRAAAILLLFASIALADSKSAPVGAATRPAIVPASEWGSKPQPIPDARKQTPKSITIHHAGVLWKAGDDAVKSLQSLQAWGQKEKKWPDLPYHFLIAPDGRIFAGRPVDYEPETNTSYKTAGHIGVELYGNFEVQRPSKEQLVALVKLVAWLAQEHQIALDQIGGHKDRAETDCPGKDLYRYFQDGQLKAWIKTAIEGGEPTIEPGPALKDGPVEPIPMK
jgi:hypothetical protein